MQFSSPTPAENTQIISFAKENYQNYRAGSTNIEILEKYEKLETKK